VEKETQNRRLQDEIIVILHRPGIPENIGATARVMANLGFDRLILSDPRTGDMETAAKLAVSASHILDRASSYPSLSEAIEASGARFLVGTTARGRRYWETEDISQAAPYIVQRALLDRTAVIFGPENIGLSNEELTLCHLLVTLPAEGELGSYNLSHAAAITLFAVLTARSSCGVKTGKAIAGFVEMEGMYEHVQNLLTETGFLWEDNPDHMMRAVRGFINRAQPSETDVKAIRGVCRRLLWHLRNKKSGDRSQPFDTAQGPEPAEGETGEGE
jgi:tRNA/rRNA methyltransferase